MSNPQSNWRRPQRRQLLIETGAHLLGHLGPARNQQQRQFGQLGMACYGFTPLVLPGSVERRSTGVKVVELPSAHMIGCKFCPAFKA